MVHDDVHPSTPYSGSGSSHDYYQIASLVYPLRLFLSSAQTFDRPSDGSGFGARLRLKYCRPR